MKTATSAKLLAIVSVAREDRVQCGQPGCGHSIYRAIHVVRDKGSLIVLGSTCFAKRYGSAATLGTARFGAGNPAGSPTHCPYSPNGRGPCATTNKLVGHARLCGQQSNTLEVDEAFDLNSLFQTPGWHWLGPGAAPRQPADARSAGQTHPCFH